jgi:hypothetical protein
MKAQKNVGRRLLFVSSIIFLTVFMLAACDKKDDNNNNSNTMYTISGNASGNQVVPAVTDSGTATISGTYDAGTKQLITTTNWSNLTGAPTGGGYYSGASGVNGTIIGSPWTFESGLTGTGMRIDTTTLTSDQETQLTGGNWYYSLATTANPGGEVRGQITATAQ